MELTFLSSFSGSDKCLELLVNQFGNEILNLQDCRKRTPLHIAALHGHTECAGFLLEHGAEISIFDEDGRTPLIAAAQYGQLQIVDLLISSKVDLISVVDKMGNTALHWACMKKHSQTALFILDSVQDNAVINFANNEKKT